MYADALNPPLIFRLLNHPAFGLAKFMTVLLILAVNSQFDCRAQDSATVEKSIKSELGQFMTPPSIAAFMANQFDPSRLNRAMLLDAGAGEGALSMAFANRWLDFTTMKDRLAICAFELDGAMIERLKPNMQSLEGNDRIKTRIIDGDFIEIAAQRIRNGECQFTHAILNPPYKKIRSDSQARATLTSVGIETVNLYSGFVALAIQLLQKDGELVAIIPRSFCNGPYYKPFRRFLLDRTAIISIHLFDSRDQAFAKDSVLQENVIIHLQKGVKQGNVSISKSTDASFADVHVDTVPFNKIVRPEDHDQFIHIPSRAGERAIRTLSDYKCTLQELGISVSTGPIVDFRHKVHLRMQPEPNAVPLLYSGHFTGGRLSWPKNGFKKPNAIVNNEATKRWLFPPGCYVVVKRFSSKEEKRRIVAALVDVADLPNSWIGFENHLNVFHQERTSLSEPVARGLVVYLNTQAVDDWFRQFNGHTQVNATDLRSLTYPDVDTLCKMGESKLPEFSHGLR